MDAYKIVNDMTDATSEYDLVREWLSPEEYKNLPSAEKWQFALQRYMNKQKTNWEIGIDYERFIGYIYESKGYIVKYQGALLGLEDMGRDLIATSKNESVVIQCKRWSTSKTIHEKHIFQLYGTVIQLRIEQKIDNIRGEFITTTTLSPKARQCADYLGITVIENKPFENYPMIKCKNSNEKIYHLPFDQQYDRLQIHTSQGDCYIPTAREAEQLGFRHAYKWKGNAQ